MQITAIILNYNNYQDIKKCIESLEIQELPKNYQLKIVIIDNGSTDGSTIKIKNRFPSYYYIFNKKNLGFARGVNQGIKAVFNDSDYFLLMNNDASLEPTGLNKMINSGADLAAPTIFYKHKPKKIWQAGGYFNKYKMGVTVPLKNLNLPNINSDQKISYLSGCILLINKKTLLEIGGLDETFFFYGEDVDFCLRARRKGLKIIYLPNVSAWHNIQDITVTRTNPFVLENLAKSYFLIIRKHFPYFIAYGLLLFIFIYTPFRALQIIKGGNKFSNIKYWLKGGCNGLFCRLKH